MGLTASLEMNIYIDAARGLAADPGVDAVVVVGAGMTPELNQQYTEAMIKARQDFQKPFLIVGIPGFDADLAQTFYQNGVPYFESAERAMRVYAQVRNYQLWREKLEL